MSADPHPTSIGNDSASGVDTDRLSNIISSITNFSPLTVQLSCLSVLFDKIHDYFYVQHDLSSAIFIGERLFAETQSILSLHQESAGEGSFNPSSLSLGEFAAKQYDHEHQQEDTNLNQSSSESSVSSSSANDIGILFLSSVIVLLAQCYYSQGEIGWSRTYHILRTTIGIYQNLKKKNLHSNTVSTSNQEKTKGKKKNLNSPPSPILLSKEEFHHRYLLSQVYLDLAKYDEAEQILEPILLSKHSAISQSSAYFLMGRIASLTGRRNFAHDCYEKALTLDPFKWSAVQALTQINSNIETNQLFAFTEEDIDKVIKKTEVSAFSSSITTSSPISVTPINFHHRVGGSKIHTNVLSSHIKQPSFFSPFITSPPSSSHLLSSNSSNQKPPLSISNEIISTSSISKRTSKSAHHRIKSTNLTSSSNNRKQFTNQPQSNTISINNTRGNNMSNNNSTTNNHTNNYNYSYNSNDPSNELIDDRPHTRSQSLSPSTSPSSNITTPTPRTNRIRAITRAPAPHRRISSLQQQNITSTNNSTPHNNFSKKKLDEIDEDDTTTINSTKEIGQIKQKSERTKSRDKLQLSGGQQLHLQQKEILSDTKPLFNEEEKPSKDEEMVEDLNNSNSDVSGLKDINSSVDNLDHPSHHGGDHDSLQIHVKNILSGLSIIFRTLSSAYSALCQYHCRDSLSLFYSLPYCHLNSGWVLMQIGRCYVECAEYFAAVEVFERAHKLDPHLMTGLEYYSTALWQLHDEIKLSFLAQEVVEYDSLTAECWSIVGNCFSLQKEHELSIKFMKRASQLQPSTAYFYTLTAHEYVANEDYDTAILLYRQAISCEPNHFNAWFGAGALYYRQEKIQSAYSHFIEAYHINKESVVLLVYIAMVSIALDQYQSAMEWIKKAELLQPNQPQVRYQKANLYCLHDQYEQAKDLLESLRLDCPRESQVHMLLGRVYARLGQYELSIARYMAAAELDPKEGSTVKQAIERVKRQMEGGEAGGEEEEEEM